MWSLRIPIKGMISHFHWTDEEEVEIMFIQEEAETEHFKMWCKTKRGITVKLLS